MLKHIIQGILIIIVLGIGGYIYLTISSTAACSNKKIDEPELTLPYYLVSTYSIPYAGKSVEVQGGGETVVISPPYYVMFKDKWELRKSGPPLTLTKSKYGEITVTLIKK